MFILLIFLYWAPSTMDGTVFIEVLIGYLENSSDAPSIGALAPRT